MKATIFAIAVLTASTEVRKPF